jgi:hypothetical protein
VCSRLVVAPPISSGTSKPWRCISLGDVDHLVQRRRDQAGQADHVDVLARRFEDLVGRHHHAQVDDLVVVALQHDADDVLADVVHVALDRGHQDLAGGCCSPLAAASSFSASMNGMQVGDRLLHHARALDHLRQEHLARAEQVADDVHAVHQRPFDDVERALAAWRASSVSSSMKSSMPLTSACSRRFGDRPARASSILLLRPCPPSPLTALGDLEQPLGGVVAAVEDHVLDGSRSSSGMSS